MTVATAVQSSEPGTKRDTETVNAEHPWPGLAAFREADQRFFRGRDTEIEELYRTVRRHRLTVLFGRSGLGKTSLLHAGLFPRERDEEALPVYVRLDHSQDSGDLAEQILEAILTAAKEANVEAPDVKEGDSLWEFFHRKDADFWSDDHRIVMPILVLDQFEELFTIGKANHPERCLAFLDELADLVEGRVPTHVKVNWEKVEAGEENFVFKRHHYKVILSLREDYLAELESLVDKMPSLAVNRFRLRGMTGSQALKVVEEPAAEANLLAPGIAEMIVRSVAGDQKADTPLEELDVDPAILSLFCRQLNEKRIAADQSQITRDLLGESNTILVDFYRHSLDGLPKRRAVRRFIEDNLVTSGHRDSVAVDRAEQALGSAKDAIEQLVQRRLVHIDPRGGLRRLELTHDVLTGVVQESRNERLEARRRYRIAGFIGTLALIAVTVVGFMWLAKRRQVERARVELETVIEELSGNQNPLVQAAVPSLVSALGSVQAILGDGDGSGTGPGPVVTGPSTDSIVSALERFRLVYDSLLTERATADSLQEELRVSQDSVSQTTLGIQTLQDSLARRDSLLIQREVLATAARDSLGGVRDSVIRLSQALEAARQEARTNTQGLPTRPHVVDRWPGLDLVWRQDSAFGFRSLDPSTTIDAPPSLTTTTPVAYPRDLLELDLPQSEVTLSAVLDAAGRIDSVEVLATDYNELNEHAIAWLEGATFTPARSQGADVPVRIVFPVTFPDASTVPPPAPGQPNEQGISVVGPSANLIVTPTFDERIVPSYPNNLFDRRVSGTVVLETVIDANGRVFADSIQVVSVDAQQGSDQFEAAARRALERSRFQPARVQDPNQPEGRPVSVRIQLTYVFRR